MNASSKFRRSLFLAFVLAFLSSALFHLGAALFPGAQPDSSVLRHLLFVGINGLAAFLFWSRPWWSIPLLAVLIAQQSTSHGRDFWVSLHSGGPIRWVDGGIIAVLLLGLGCLSWDVWSRGQEPIDSGGT